MKKPMTPTKGMGGAMKGGATRPVGGGYLKAARPVTRSPRGRR